MKALVTGGGGFLGGAVVRLLRERGDCVRSFSRGDHAALNGLGVEQVRGDLADPLAVARAVDGCDIVFHIAAKAGVWGAWREYYDANVVGTNNVLTACKQHRVQRLVFTSSPSCTFANIDQNGVNESQPYPKRFLAHYPRSKALAEQAVLAANGPDLATVALRPHLIWGRGDPHLIPRIIERARTGRLRKIGMQPKLVDTTHVENAATAHLLAGDRLTPGSPIGGRAYFISQGEPRPLWDFINRVLEMADLPPVTQSISPMLAYAIGAVLERVYWLCRIRREPFVTRFVARELSTAHWFDISAARRDLNYQPRVATEAGLQDLSEWLHEITGLAAAKPKRLRGK